MEWTKASNIFQPDPPIDHGSRNSESTVAHAGSGDGNIGSGFDDMEDVDNPYGGTGTTSISGSNSKMTDTVPWGSPRSPDSSIYDLEDADDTLVQWMKHDATQLNDDGNSASITVPGSNANSDIDFYFDSDATSNTTASLNDEAINELEKEWKIGCFQRNLAGLAYARWRFQAQLSDRPKSAVAVTAISAAIAYLFMMMLRFPMLVGTIDDEKGKPFKSIMISWKSTAVIAFGIGYTLGKIPSIFLVSKLRPWKRLKVMLFIASFGFVTTVGFFTIASPETEACLLIVGSFVLASLYGVVSQYLEGRQFTEVMVSTLSASLMLGGPLARYLAALLKERGIAERDVPVILGSVFLPISSFAMLILDTVPPPTRLEANRKAERRPLSLKEGLSFMSEYLFGILCALIAYTLVCALRNYREYFASDIYSKALSQELKSWHFLALDVPSTLVVFLAISLLSSIKDNRLGFFAVLGVVLLGAILVITITWCYESGYIGKQGSKIAGVIWLESIAAGTYLMYIPMGFLLFDRLIASTKFAGTALFLVNIADVFGQAASVGIVTYREADFHNTQSKSADFHKYFISLIYPIVGLVLMMTAMVFFYFLAKLEKPISIPKRSLALNIQGDSQNIYEDDEPLLQDRFSRPSIRAFQPTKLQQRKKSNPGVVARCASTVSGRSISRRDRGDEVDTIVSGDETLKATANQNPALFFECQDCAARFSDQIALRIHVRDTHLSVPAWHNEPTQVKCKIKALADDIRNFTRRLPYNKQVAKFDPDLFQKCAKASMEAQPELRQMFHECVPSRVNSMTFWSNYAFRVNCIVEAFYSDPRQYQYRNNFPSPSSYGKYMRRHLTVPGTKVVACDDFADVKEGDIGTFVSNDEPSDPPVQVRFERLNGVRFLPWHNLEFSTVTPRFGMDPTENTTVVTDGLLGASTSPSATTYVYE